MWFCVQVLNNDVNCIYFLICIATSKVGRNIVKLKMKILLKNFYTEIFIFFILKFLKNQVTDWINTRYIVTVLEEKKISEKLKRKMTQ